MALFLPRGHQRPNAVCGRIGGHPQARGLVHWVPGLGSDPFSGGGPFVGVYSGLADVAGSANVKEAYDLFKVTQDTLSGTTFYTPDTAYHQTCAVFVPKPWAFQGAAAGGAGATISVWVKMRYHTPPDTPRSGLCFANEATTGVPGSSYPWADNNAYLAVLRHDRITFALPNIPNRTEWHLVTITHTGYVWRLYQNAQLTHENTTGNGHVYVGRVGFNNYVALQGMWSDGNHVLIGHACDWRFYNRALDQGDIQTMYDPGTRWSLYYGV